MPGVAPRRRWELALAIIVKDERDYLPEWIAYHHAIGVEHMFVYDHGSTDGTREAIAPWVNRGLVTVIDWPRVHGQFDAYEHAIRTATGQTEWLGIIDTDEFICQVGEVSLREHLRTLDADQLLIRWRWFGHSGRRTRPRGLVIENYDRVRPELSNIVKSIFRPEMVIGAAVHAQRTVSGRTVDLAGRTVHESWQLRLPATGPEPFQVNHYYCRSYEEYLHKMARGDANVNKAQAVRAFEEFDFDGVDRTLVDFAPVVRDRMNAMAQLPVDPLPSGSLGGGVAPMSPVALYHLLRDRMLDEAEAFGARATFKKSDQGIRIRYEAIDGDTDALVERLRPMLATLGDRWGAINASVGVEREGAVSPVLARTWRRLRGGPFEGHLFAAVLARTSDTGSIVMKLNALIGGENWREVGRLRLRGEGLWVAVQRVGSRPSVPLSVRFGWDTPVDAVHDARLWFVS